MEKENVLQVNITLIDKKYSYLKIIEQDCEVLKRDIFRFKASNDIKIYSVVGPAYIIDSSSIDGSTLYIWGSCKEFDDSPAIVPNQDIPLIEQAIKELNEKYGRLKRWRADISNYYYSVSSTGKISICNEKAYNIDKLNYEFGNYFKTKEQAEECKKRIKKVIDDYHQEIGE